MTYHILSNTKQPTSFPSPREYPFTWANYSMIIGNQPGLIVDIQEGNYELILANRGEEIIFLYIGDEGDSHHLSLGNTGLDVQPFQQKTWKGYLGGKIYGIAESDCKIGVSIHSDVRNPLK